MPWVRKGAEIGIDDGRGDGVEVCRLVADDEMQVLGWTGLREVLFERAPGD